MRGADAKDVLDQASIWIAGRCSCTLWKVKLDAKADEASGDRAMTSATRDAEN